MEALENRGPHGESTARSFSAKFEAPRVFGYEGAMRIFVFALISLFAAVVQAAPAAPAAAPARAVTKEADTRRLTVAVAPFVTSSDQEYRWLGLGFAQALITELL